MSNQSRRNFLRHTTLAAGAISALRVLGQSSDVFAQGKPTVAVDESSAMAKALGYVHDGSKADATRFPQVKDAIAKGNNCSKCSLLTEKGLKADGHEGAWGRCTLFPTGLVNEHGWCMSFAPKAS